MIIPVRLQLSRRKGYSLQAATVAANGLPAVIVARPGPWGNPFRIGHTRRECEGEWEKVEDAATAVRFFREMLTIPQRNYPTDAQVATLRGKNLACWCKLGDPCHADVLLELANREPAAK